jgi:hypothetical protein
MLPHLICNLTHSLTLSLILDLLAEHEIFDAAHQRLQRHGCSREGLPVPLVPAVQEDVEASHPLL